jgi:hypothetical protein
MSLPSWNSGKVKSTFTFLEVVKVPALVDHLVSPIDLVLSFETKVWFIKVPPHPVSNRILALFKCFLLKLPFVEWTYPNDMVQNFLVLDFFL